jgi:hypothetical protein
MFKTIKIAAIAKPTTTIRIPCRKMFSLEIFPRKAPKIKSMVKIMVIEA